MSPEDDLRRIFEDLSDVKKSVAVLSTEISYAGKMTDARWAAVEQAITAGDGRAHARIDLIDVNIARLDQVQRDLGKRTERRLHDIEETLQEHAAFENRIKGMVLIVSGSVGFVGALALAVLDHIWK